MFVVGGGQEVAGVEACAQDKWSDRCGDGSVGRPLSPSVFGSRPLLPSCGRDASEESEFQFSHIHSRFVFSIFCVRVTTSTICHTASHSTAALFL